MFGTCPQGYSEEFCQIVRDCNEVVIGSAAWAGILVGLFLTFWLMVVEWLSDIDCILLLPFPLPFSNMLAVPMGLFLLYHPVTLPAWLTFGPPFVLGGIIPNNCEDASLVPFPYGGWPCFLPRLKIWLAKIVGPRGWEYLVQPEPMLLPMLALCLGYATIWVLYLRLMPSVIRESRQKTEEKRRQRSKM